MKSRNQPTYSVGKFTIIGLVEWLVLSVSACDLAIEYKGVEPYKARGRTYHSGDTITLGTLSGLMECTGWTIEGQKNLIDPEKQARRDDYGRHTPPVPEFYNWINLSKLLQILYEQGTPVRNWETGEPVVFYDKVVDGQVWHHWQQLRDRYESEALSPEQDYYSPVITNYLNPPKVKAKAKKGVLPPTQEKSTPVDNEVIDLADLSLTPSEKSLLSSLPKDAAAEFLEFIRAKKSQSPLARLTRRYMEQNNLASAEELGTHLMKRQRIVEPSSHPFYSFLVEALNTILNGKTPQPMDPGFILLKPLAEVLEDESGQVFGDVTRMLEFANQSSSVDFD